MSWRGIFNFGDKYPKARNARDMLDKGWQAFMYDARMSKDTFFCVMLIPGEELARINYPSVSLHRSLQRTI